MNLVCPYCYADMDEEYPFCCGEAGHGVEKRDRRVYFVGASQRTDVEPHTGWYVSDLVDTNDGGRPTWHPSKAMAEQYLEDES